jgi:hypothetical protein
MRRTLLPLVMSVASVTATAQSSKATVVPAAIARIREADLKRDLYAMAGDEMRGREAGTLDEMRASVWTADQMQAIGLKPMGDFGSYLQWWNIRRTRISTVSSSVRIGSQTIGFWSDITPTSNAAVDVTASTLFVGDGRDTTVDVRGKVVVALLQPPPANFRQTTANSYEYRYARAAITATAQPLTRRGAAAVILVADSITERVFDGVAKVQSRGTYGVDSPAQWMAPQAAGGRGGGAGGPTVTPVPVLLARRGQLATLRADGQAADIRIRSESFDYPSANVIGVVRGTDPKLRDEYVLFSSHQDHDGVRFAVDGDSIWNGADDNATTSVALLAIARAFVAQPGKRSALFVFHGAEERGLLGSRYHAGHPVVPIDKIVAVLNGDMLGRNHPDSAALMGSQPPHRNSTDLVQMAFAANAATAKFAIDSLWDRPTHPEGWYFRSDHVPYARFNVPALFFSSNLHPDYHTPRDEPKTIDYPKLTRMTKWIYLTGWLAANTPVRPGVDPGFKLER